MTDVVLGMGEIGETLFDLLEERGIDCVGIDAESTKCKNLKRVKLLRLQNIYMFVLQENYQTLKKLLKIGQKKLEI